jgi:2-succinyl-6-hydroxy-2,4-cyclohexadiene-1-carboxylate synthase
MGSCAEFVPYAEALSIGHPSLLIDLPGHGRSPWNPDTPLSIGTVSTALKNLLDEKGIGSFVLIGYSMGGRVALSHGLRAANACRGVLATSSHPGLTSAVERKRRRMRDAATARRLAQMPLSEFVRAWYGSEVFRGLRLRPDLRARVMDSRLDNDPLALAEVLMALGTGKQKPLWRDLSRTSIPMRWVVGKRDGKYAAVARRASTLSHRIDHVVVRDAGHMVHIESPSAYLGAVESFLSNHARQSRHG